MQAARAFCFPSCFNYHLCNVNIVQVVVKRKVGIERHNSTNAASAISINEISMCTGR